MKWWSLSKEKFSNLQLLHQEEFIKNISGNIFFRLYQHLLENNPCDVFSAPFDVRLPVKSKRNEDIFTVVQPDISVLSVTNPNWMTWDVSVHLI
jgi:hypothetical protein